MGARTRLVAAAVVVLLGGVAACSGDPAAAPTSTATLTATPPPLWMPSGEDIQAVCDGRAQPAAPPRAAAPPRPIRVFERTSGSWHRTDYYREFTDPKTTQLVGCLSLTSTARRPLTSCDYLGNKSYGMHPATYRMTVREVRTARVLSDRTFTGSDAECPEWLYGEPPQRRLATDPATSQITALLEPSIRR